MLRVGQHLTFFCFVLIDKSEILMRHKRCKENTKNLTLSLIVALLLSFWLFSLQLSSSLTMSSSSCILLQHQNRLFAILSFIFFLCAFFYFPLAFLAAAVVVACLVFGININKNEYKRNSNMFFSPLLFYGFFVLAVVRLIFLVFRVVCCKFPIISVC